MSTITKKAIVQAMVEGQLTELMVKSHVDNIFVDDTTTLAAKLAEMITDIGLRAKSTDVTTEINAAISALIDGAPETYNTLKEIADYIDAHQDVVDGLNAAIGNKADKTAFENLQTAFNSLKATVDGLGTLATKSKVSESDLDADLAAKVNASAQANHAHDNKTVLDGITAEKVTAWDAAEQNAKTYADGLNTAMDTRVAAVEGNVEKWNGNATVYYSATEPVGMTEKDLWFKIVE